MVKDARELKGSMVAAHPVYRLLGAKTTRLMWALLVEWKQEAGSLPAYECLCGWMSGMAVQVEGMR